MMWDELLLGFMHGVEVGLLIMILQELRVITLL